MPRTGISIVPLVVLALVALCGSLVLAAGSATARGAVYVRRAPTSTSPAFATLTKGTSVSVEHVTGRWAAVTLASGERGYVHTAYLDLPAGVPATVDPTARPPTEPPPADTQTPEVTWQPEVSRQDLELQLAQLRERIVALEAAVTPVAGAPEAPREGTADASPPAEQAEPDAGAETSALPLQTPAPAGIAEQDGVSPERDISPDIAPTLALAGVGLVVGFLLGTAYGQRQERNRSTRVRF